MLYDIGWEVGARAAVDSDVPPDARPIPYALVRLTGAEGTASPYFLPEFDEVLLTVDQEDVAFLRDSLERLSAALEKQGADIEAQTAD